jgi:hypothetical protein
MNATAAPALSVAALTIDRADPAAASAELPAVSGLGITEPEWLPAGQDLRDVALQLRLLLTSGTSFAIATVLGARGTAPRQPSDPTAAGDRLGPRAAAGSSKETS